MYRTVLPTGPGGELVEHTYGRAFAYMNRAGVYDPEGSGYADLRDRFLGAMPGATTTDRILVAGCGFGFTIDRFRAAGYPNTWGIDDSAWIEARKGVEAVDATVWVADTITGGGRVRTALRQLTGASTFDWVLTEGILESLEDAEMPTVLNACESVLAGSDLARIVHMVWVPPFAPRFAGVFNEKTIDAWNAMRPAHTWVSDLGEVR